MIFSIRQLLVKCKEQNMPLNIGLIDLTKALDLVSREGLFAILLKIGCPPSLFKIVQSFHIKTRTTIQCDGRVSNSFEITNGVKQGCVLAPPLFGILFSMLLQRGFGCSSLGIKLHTRTDGSLFNLSSLTTKRKKTSLNEIFSLLMMLHSFLTLFKIYRHY